MASDNYADKSAEVAANALLQELISGKICLDNGNSSVGCDSEDLSESARAFLLEAFDNWGDEALEILQSIAPAWSEDRIVALIHHQDAPSEEELKQIEEHLLGHDDECRFIVYVGVFPVPSNDPKGWAVIREAGIGLDREYEIDGIFPAKEAAESFVERRYGMQ